METKKNGTEIDWNALGEYWAERYEKEFGHFFITSIKWCMDMIDMDMINMNTIKDNYPEGVCPECKTWIPDDAVDGTECKNCGHVFHSANTIKYKVLLHWDDFRKYPPREGEITTGGYTIEEILDRIFYQEQNDTRSKDIPSASELDVIDPEDGRRFRNRIFYQEQNVTKSKDVPSASELDVIELEDGRRFRILDLGFNELCSKDDDRSCVICAKFYLKREDVPKAVHMNVRNTFYKNGKNNLCEKCFRMWGIK